ncbi:MAG: N-6 DNA methylase, partial [Limisphaerales bacterium]
MRPAASNSDPRPLARRLEAYGCTSVIRLDDKLSAPGQLDYLDLLPKQSNHTPLLTAVAEHQGTALLYIVDASGDVKSDADSLASVRRQLANRSDPAWLGVVRPGSLEIFPIGFDATADSRPVRTIEERSTTAPMFFQSLVHGTFEENHRLRGTDYVFHKIFDLLTRTTNEFVPKEGKGELDALEVLSMAGRALFFRFLIDRDIVRPNELHGRDGICPAANELKDAFSTAEKAAQTSAWLDATFNGDFLPLIDESIPADNREAREAAYLRFFKRTEGLVGKRIFTHLHAILRGWRATGDAVQTELDWGDLDFAHIPVGVLSQVYESFSHRADPLTARDTSVHYTPRTIAGLMVEEAFAATKDKAGAKVLDSSCGAGIFLVLAFRRLVREQWNAGERPKTSVIQGILYNQVRGFDISESALRLAALALYITAIELNASPRPPQALKFPRSLRGAVLHRFGGEEVEGRKAFPLGSLGPEVSPDFNRTFDIVIGNPPWTRLRDYKDEDD